MTPSFASLSPFRCDKKGLEAAFAMSLHPLTMKCYRCMVTIRPSRVKILDWPKMAHADLSKWAIGGPCEVALRFCVVHNFCHIMV